MKKRIMKKRIVSLLLIMIVCLHPALVHAESLNTGNLKSKYLTRIMQLTKDTENNKEVMPVVNEETYTGTDLFGYDAFESNGKLEGVQVLVDGTVLTKGKAECTVDAVITKGVKLIFDEGYQLKQYKVVCGEKYGNNMTEGQKGSAEKKDGAVPAKSQIVAVKGMQKHTNAVKNPETIRVAATNAVKEKNVKQEEMVLTFDKKMFENTEEKQHFGYFLI